MTMTMTTMRTRTRLVPLAAILTILFAGTVLLAQKGTHAVVAGSVFRESGFSLPGATVTLMAKGSAKGKGLKSVTDARGEFAFRVPPAVGNYVVTASMKGFKPVQAEASVGGEERVDVTLVLSTESK
jgi:carboxypeptidase family protein